MSVRQNTLLPGRSTLLMTLKHKYLKYQNTTHKIKKQINWEIYRIDTTLKGLIAHAF